MNLLGSRINKSKALIGRSVQTVAAYSCELYIQSFKISHRGFVYFVWNSNSSQIQSLRYESNGRSVQVKQTLTISLRMALKNGKDIPLSTYLRLMAEDGQQLDQFQISMNNLNAQFKQMEIPMDRGVVNIQIRRKTMNIAEPDMQFQQRGFLRMNRIEEKSMTHITGEYETLQEQLGRIKKDLQDAVYLNNKLKNDRDVLLATKQQLQLQIQTMIIQITKEISVLRQHFDNRISIRQHTYQQQIQNLVNLFNSNADHSKKTLQTMLKQKIRAEEELKVIEDKIKIFQISIVKKNEQLKCLQRQKWQLQQKLTLLSYALTQKDKTIDVLNKQKQQMQTTIHSQNARIQNLSIEIEQKKQSIQQFSNNINDLTDKVRSQQTYMQQKDKIILELQAEIQGYQERQTASINQKELLKKQIGHIQSQKNTLQAKVEELSVKLQESLFEMQFNQNVLANLKKHSSQKEEELYYQLQNLQRMYSQKIEQIVNSFHYQKGELHNTNLMLQHQNSQYSKMINELEEKIKVCELSLSQLREEVQLKQGKSLQKDGQIIQLTKQNQELKQENNNLKNGMVNSKLDQSQTNKQLAQKINILQDEIKRLKETIAKKQGEIQALKIERQRRQEGFSSHSAKYSKHSRQLQKILSGPLNHQQVREIVITKQRQISQLRKRVDYLQNLYDGLQNKMQEIARKYPQIDIGDIREHPIQWCQSEQEQQKLVNNSIRNIGVTTTPKIKRTDSFIKRKDSIGVIIQKNQDTISNSSLRVKAEQHHPFYPRSEKRIADDYKRGVLRRQSLDKDRIQLPRAGGNSIKRQGSHKSYGLSDRSGSYVKVSHSKKIRDLQQENKELNERLREYENQLDGNNRTIASLKKEIQTAKQIINQNRPHSPQLEAIKISQESQVFIEDQRFKTFMQESQMKEFEIHQMNLRLGEVQNNLKNEKSQGIKKIGLLQFKIAEYQKKMQEATKNCEELAQRNKHLQKIIEELQAKLKQEKQKNYQNNLKAKQLQMLLQNAQNELKRIKAQKQSLEQKLQKLSGSQATIRQLTKQIDDLGKKGLEQTRMLNHLKLQKDAIQEQQRLAKKRQNQYIRVAAEWEEKAASLERSIEEQKRKEGKLRRQVEEAQEEIRRAKFNMKKVQEELQTLSSAQSQWQTQRRKYLDQIHNIQDQLSKKDYELNKASKELQKWKQRAQERQEQRIGKKGELRQQIDRLESQLIRRQKRILQQTQDNKLLKGRLQLLQRQNKRIVQQKNQTYGQKLKYYVDEMGNIKKLLDSYQQENTRLKVDNTQIYQELQMLRINYEKLQIKYEENINREENMLADLQVNLRQIDSLKQRLAYIHHQLQQAESAVVSLRKEVDQYKLRERKITERLEVTERNYQKCLAQSKEMKVKINEYETNNEINGKLADRYKLLQRQKNELQQEYRGIKYEYNNIVNVFVYKKEDLEKCISQTRMQEKKIKDQQIQRIGQQNAKLIVAKTQRLEKQILQLYNEINGLKSQSQLLKQENGKQKARLIELQIFYSKQADYVGQNEELQTLAEQLKEQLDKKDQKIKKLDYELQIIEVQCGNKQRQVTNLVNRIKDLQTKIQKLNEQFEIKRRSERQLQDILLKVNQARTTSKMEEQYELKQRQSQLIQQYQSKIIAFQGQIVRLKDINTRSIEQHGSKMKKLEQKMNEMEQALKQRQKTIESHYESEIRQLQTSLLRLSQQLQQKIIRIDQLNEAIIMLQNQNKDLLKQNQSIKYQFQDEREQLEQQLNKMKNKFKEAETNYATHLKSLEQDIMKQKNFSSSRVKVNEGEDRAAKRYQQKMRGKDRKIEQMKQTICSLEETVVKLKKKENSYQSTLVEVQKFKTNYTILENQKISLQAKYEEQINKHMNIIRDLRRQVLLLKQNEQRLKLMCQQKNFQSQSINSQLKTIRQLYQQLQKELQKRKNSISAQLQQDTNLQIKIKQNEVVIKQLQEQIQVLLHAKKQLQLELKRKSSQVKKYNQVISQKDKKEETQRQIINKLTDQLTKSKKALQQINGVYERQRLQGNKIKMEFATLKKSHQEGRSLIASKQQKIRETQTLNDQLKSKLRESQQYAKRYKIISQKSKELMGQGIEQAIDRLVTYVKEKQAQINSLSEQIQQLKFISERKYLDYDEMKKQNCDLRIKVEDMELLSGQVENLRKICDRLQEQKKKCMFGQEVLRIQLQSLAKVQDEDIRGRVQAILSNTNMPAYINFSFY